jgi:enamine deaminase RidA (YjgF/YER057c/UK114 family)
MAEKTEVVTSNAPKALPGIYSQAIKANGFVFVSGAVPMDPVSNKIIDGDIKAHTVRYRLYTSSLAQRFLSAYLAYPVSVSV